MDAINSAVWELIQENTAPRSGWVDMRGLRRELSEWTLDGGHILNEFRELAAHGLITILPSDDGGDIQLLVRKTKWFCPACDGSVSEVPSEHMLPCLRLQRKKAGWAREW
jgi:hypothetical protein